MAPMIDPEWLAVLKRELVWADGFAAAVDNRHLITWVKSMRENLNRMSRGEALPVGSVTRFPGRQP